MPAALSLSRRLQPQKHHGHTLWEIVDILSCWGFQDNEKMVTVRWEEVWECGM